MRQEDEVSLKQQDDSSKLKQRDGSAKLKQKEDGSKLKRKEDGSKPKQKEDHPKLKQKEDSSKANQKHAESNVRQEDEVNVKQRDDSSKLKQDGSKLKQREDGSKLKQRDDSSKLKQDGSKLKQREDGSNAKQRDDESSVRQRDDSSKATKKSLCLVNQKKIVQNPAAKVSHISKSTDILRKEKDDRTFPKPSGEKGNGKCRVVSGPRAAIRGEEDKENTSIVLLTDVSVSQTPRHGHATNVAGSGKKQKTKKDSVLQGGKPPVRARKRSADEATKKRSADHGGTIVLEQTATPCNPRASVACESNAGRLVELSCHLKLSVLANVLDTVVCVSIWTPVAVYRRMALPGDIRQLR